MAPPRKDTQQINLRLEANLLTEIDALRRQIENPPTRPEMIRRILMSWLASSDGSPPPEAD